MKKYNGAKYKKLPKNPDKIDWGKLGENLGHAIGEMIRFYIASKLAISHWYYHDGGGHYPDIHNLSHTQFWPNLLWHIGERNNLDGIDLAQIGIWVTSNHADIPQHFDEYDRPYFDEKFQVVQKHKTKNETVIIDSFNTENFAQDIASLLNDYSPQVYQYSVKEKLPEVNVVSDPKNEPAA